MNVASNKNRSHKVIARAAEPMVEMLEARQLLSTSVVTYHNDTIRDGVNSTEISLTPANVKVGSFGKIFTTVLDGNAYAEPLVVTGEQINAGVNTAAVTPGTYDVVYVETENDSIYAINSTSGTILWQRSFLSTTGTGTTAGTDVNNSAASAITPPTSAEINCTDIGPTYGITGTPVIDIANNRMYVVPLTKEIVNGVAHYIQRLHAINLSDGTDVVTPYLIGDTTGTNTNNTNIYVYGNGDGAVTDPYNGTGKNVVQFNAITENQRSALSLVNNTLYVCYASHCDEAPYHGWVVTWNVANLPTNGFVLSGVMCPSPNGGGAGIWGSGGALTFDPDVTGTFYYETGNGFGQGNGISLDANGNPVGAAYFEAVVKAVPDTTTTPQNQNATGWGLKVADYFIPYNQAALDNADADLGSGSPIALPDSAGIANHPHLLVAAGKQGVIYLIDRDNMGKYSPTNDNVINSVPNGSGNNTPPVNVTGVLCTPVYFNNTLYYVAGYGGPSRAFSISANGTLVAKSQSAISNYGYLPGSPVLSANGLQNGIIWQTDRNTNELHAFDAASYSTELWNSAQKANSADAVGAVVKFATPTVANGEVFVGTTNSLVVYGLTPPASAAPVAPVLSVTALSGSSVNLTWTDTTATPNFATGYLIEQSTDGTNFTQVTTAGASARALALGGLNTNTKYYFRIRSQNSVGLSPYSAIVNVTTTSTTTNSVSLSSYFNRDGIVNDGTTFTNGGLDTAGYSYSANVLGSSAAWNGNFYAFGATAVNDVVSASGQSISVPQAPYANLSFLAAGVNGSQPGQTFVVNYSDGTTQTITQGVSDWLHPQSYTGESSALLMNHRDLANGSQDAESTYVYGYSVAVNPSKTLVSITLPNNANVELLALDLQSVTSAPNAPTALGAVPASATSVNLSWTANSTNQTGYLLDRATDSGFTQNLITQTLPATPNSYTDIASGLASGGTYYYRLRATNSAGPSGYSNLASVYIPFAPAKPINCVLDSVTTTTINLHWTDLAGPTATGYHILRAVNGGAFSLYTTLPSATASAPSEYDWSDTGLTPGTFYDYHIQAFNIAGYNDFVGGNGRTLTTAPTAVTAASFTAGIALAWTAPAGASTYNVYRGTAAGAESTTPIATGITAATYTDLTVAAGTKYFYYVAAVNSNIAPLNSISAASAEVSATGAAVSAVPGLIQAENYDTGGEGVGYHDLDPANRGGAYRNDGVDVENTADTGGGYEIGYVQAGEWTKYTVNVASAGNYTLGVRVASAVSGGVFHLESNGVNLTGALTVPNTGGWQNWTTLTTTVSLAAGKQTLKLSFDAAPNAWVGNFNWLQLTPAPVSTPYGSTPAAVPGIVQAENYDLGGEGVAYHDNDAANLGGEYRTDGVDIETTGDTGGGYDVGYIQAGEWLKYTISVATAGTYTFIPRVANVAAGGTFHIEIDGANVSGALTIPNTGAWQTYANLSTGSISLTAGTHVMRVAFDSAASNGWVGNLNYITINAAAANPAGPSASPTAEVASNAVTAQPASKLTGTPIGTPTSYTGSGDAIARVFDGNLNTFYDAKSAGTSSWVRLDFGSPKTVKKIKYAPRAGFENRMVGGIFQVSNTADFSSNVITLYTITTAPPAGILSTISVNPGDAYWYLRYTGGTEWVNIAEMEIYQ